MRKLCLLVFIFILSSFLYAQDIPQAAGWINDFAGVITKEYKEKLNSLIEELEQKTTVEIVVVTISSILPYDEKEYARLLFDSYKPGKKDKDNGILVLVAIKERRWRIETGYGLEGILPDGLCGEIGREEMVPYFKEGNYGQGLYRGVVRMTKIIAQDSRVTISKLEDAQPEGLGVEFLGVSTMLPLLGIVTIIAYLVVAILRFNFWRRFPRRRRKDFFGHWMDEEVSPGGSWGGGFGGGGFGGFGGGSSGGGGAGGGF